MSEKDLIEKMLKEIETILYLNNPVTDRNVAERIIGILEKEYDI